MAYEILLYNPDDSPATAPVPNALAAGTSVLFPGPAIGVTGVSFTPEGCALDKIATLAFRVPLDVTRNNAIVEGMKVSLRDTDTGIVMGRGRVLDRTIAVGNAGMFAQIQCADLLDELRQPTTRGYAAAPGETLSTTLIALLVGTPKWTVLQDIGAAYDGVDFAAPGLQSVQGYAKLATERTAHFKRSPHPDGVTRLLNFGRFGQDAGIALTNMAESPSRAAQANPYIRLIDEGGLSIARNLTIVNTLIPTGAGSGIAQLTLESLYTAAGETNLGGGVFQSGPAAFQGADGAHPIRKRPNPSTASGFEYFVQDDASVAAYGAWEQEFPQPGIAPTTATANSPTLVAAAASLYLVALSALAVNGQPHEEYTVVTEGRGDIRDIAGRQVRLIYRGMAREYSANGAATGQVAIDRNTMLTVMEVVRSEADDGTQKDTWTLSNLVKYLATTTSIVVGGLAQIKAGSVTAQTYLDSRPLPFFGYADAAHPLTRTFPGDLGIYTILKATAYIFAQAVQSPTRPKFHGHAVVTLPTAHDIGTGVTLDVAVPALDVDIPALPVTGIPQLLVDNAALAPYTGATAVSAKLISGVVTLVTAVANKGNAPLSGSPTQTTAATTQTHATHATATTGGTGGAVKPTAGGTGGATVAKTHPYVQAATGATAAGAQGEVGMEFGMFVDPGWHAPTLALMVGATAVAGGAGGAVDITAAVIAANSGRDDFAVTITPSGFTELSGFILVEAVKSLIAAR